MAVNQPSRRVMEKCGLAFVRGYYSDDVPAIPGAEQGKVEYALTPVIQPEIPVGTLYRRAHRPRPPEGHRHYPRHRSQPFGNIFHRTSIQQPPSAGTPSTRGPAAARAAANTTWSHCGPPMGGPGNVITHCQSGRHVQKGAP